MRKLYISIVLGLILISMMTIEITVNAQSSNNHLAYYSLAKRGGIIDPQVGKEILDLQAGEHITVIVTLTNQVDLSQIPGANREARLKGVTRALQAFSKAEQQQISAYLISEQAKGNVSGFSPFWIFNGLSVTANQQVVQSLTSRDDVARITADDIQVETVSSASLASAEPNLDIIQAPALWGLGYLGQGIVVANLDSGVDVNHPDLSSNYRGGSNSWYDPFGEHPLTPVDFSGHGTWTMGVMVGGDSGGTSIGVAPQAEWIAAKIFNDSGSSTSTAIHLAYQWLLDPDGDIGTDDAPHVVNNSWTFSVPGCNMEFELDLQSLRAAGILPVFSAGNGGPSPNTSYSPANNPSAFSVGATDNADGLYAYSSRGPTDCGGSSRVFPEMVAPGMNIRTTDLSGLYTSATGTSLAAPHVSGGLALLLSAFPDLSADYQSDAFLTTSLDLGVPGADYDFGYGRLDLLSAYNWLTQNPEPTPTPMPTPDPTINLALNKPVVVSSENDPGIGGGMAVDGDLSTFWQSAKTTRKNGLPSEWIQVDLGAGTQVGRVVLVWNSFYATDYIVQVSNDGSSWSTVFTATAGDGGSDEITFFPTSARYILLETTGWSNSTWRVALSELEVYSGGGVSPTPTPPPTLEPTPTPTPGPVEYTHLGDMTASSSIAPRNRWDAQISFQVYDELESPIEGVTVSGTWTSGVSGSGSCLTDASGVCTITKTNIKGNTISVEFTIADLSHPNYQYLPTANHNAGGEAIGSSITIAQP